MSVGAHVHVYPQFGREHEVDTSPCWCSPQMYTLCPACGGKGCPACQPTMQPDGDTTRRGLTPTTDEQAADVIVHRAVS